MATSNKPAKKAAAKEVKPLWMWMEKGDTEAYGTFTSRDAAIKDAKKDVQENYQYRNYRKDEPVILIFQQTDAIKLNVTVEEVPVTSFKTTVTVK